MTMRTAKFALAILAPLSLSLFAGCDPGGPETVPVSGKVTFAGKPVGEGTVKFWSDATGTMAVGQIGPDGSYKLTTHPNLDGAVLGTHKVTIRSVQTLGEGPTERLLWLVPPRYDNRQQTPLTAEVKADSTTFNFDLPAEMLPK